MRFQDESGLETAFGRVPDWARDAYQTNSKGAVVHLVSRHWDGAVLTLCGYVEEGNGAVQIVEEPTEHTEGWDGLHRCYHCERFRRAMLREREKQTTSN